MLLGVRIRNFEALTDVTLGQDPSLIPDGQTLEVKRVLKDLTGVIGANNVGKSSFFRSLEFLFIALQEGLAAAAVHGSNIGFNKLISRQAKEDMRFDLLVFSKPHSALLSYHLSITSDKHGRPRITKEEAHRILLTHDEENQLVRKQELQIDKSRYVTCLDLKQARGVVLLDGELKKAEILDRKVPALAVYGRMLEYESLTALYSFISSWYFCHIPDTQSDDVRRTMQDKHRLQLANGMGEHHHLNADGSNVANVLAYIKANDSKHYTKVMNEIKIRLPDAKGVFERIKKGQASPGEMKLFSLFLLFSDPDPRAVIFIENPDQGLYFNMIDELAIAIRAYILQNEDSQILFSTHSPNLVESLAPDECWLMFKQDDASGTVAQSVDDIPLVRQFYEEGVGLSSLMYSGHLEPPFTRSAKDHEG